MHEVGEKRVLFVDDEPLVLTALRRSLRGVSWQIRFATSGPEALEELEREGADLIVSDLFMPGMDGIQFLQLAREICPQGIRLVLSAYFPKLASQLDIAAHQVLRKPWDPFVMRAKLDRLLRLRDDVSRPALRARCNAVPVLRGSPTSVEALNDLLSQAHLSVHSITQVVREDPAMTAKVLQLVNSAFFALPKRISDATEAVEYLGVGNIRGALVNRCSMECPHQDEANARARQLSQTTLPIAQLAAHMMESTEEKADAFTAGLLSEVAQLAAVCCQGANQSPLSVAPDEEAPAGAYLLGLWGLPAEVVDAVAHSRIQRPAAGRVFDAGDAVNIARCMSRGDPLDDMDYIDGLGVGPRLDGWREKAAELCGT